MKRLGGDEVLFNKMLNRLEKDLPHYLLKMALAYDSEDYDSFINVVDVVKENC